MKPEIPAWIKYLYTSVSVFFFIIIFPEHNNLFFELIVSGAVYIIIAGILTGIILLALTRSTVVTTGLLVCLLSLITIFSNTVNLINLTSSNQKSEREISLLQLNVYLYNRKKMSTINAVMKKQPHIITLHEVSRNWDTSLKTVMKKNYPYRVSVPGSFFGLSLYSRFPIIDYSIESIDKTIILISEILIDKTKISVVTYHSYAPLNEEQLIYRNNQINALIPVINKIRGPKIVTGDFNAVPWSWIMKKFKDQTSLSDGRTGLLNTYPSRGLIRVPIDYIMYSEHFYITGNSSSFLTPSDHLGIVSTCVLNDRGVSSARDSRRYRTQTHSGIFSSDMTSLLRY